MTNFQTDISFSKAHSNKRIQQAAKHIGLKSVNRMIALSLFFLGGNREQISDFLQIPIGTFFSLLTRFPGQGIDALIDKREKPKPKAYETNIETQTPAKTPQNDVNDSTVCSPVLEIVLGEQRKVLNVSPQNRIIAVETSNTLQFKIIILSFVNARFLTPDEAGQLLSYSERHVRTLCKKLQSDDINALLDKRQGQQKDYVFTDQIKAQLIQQYVLNLVTGASTSSSKITSQLNKTCNSGISERTVRQHQAKLGLNKLKKSLPGLLKQLKKSSGSGR